MKDSTRGVAFVGGLVAAVAIGSYAIGATNGDDHVATNRAVAAAVEVAATEGDTPAVEAHSGGAGTMPNVVGMDLQSAQDKIQADTDLFWSDSHDATGRGRMQIIDSNWVVVDQHPAAGTPLDDGDTPVLDVVKHGER